MKSGKCGSKFSPIRGPCLGFDPVMGSWRHRPYAPSIVVNFMLFPNDTGTDSESDHAREDDKLGDFDTRCSEGSGDEGLEEGWWEWVWSHLPVFGASVYRATHWIGDVWDGIDFHYHRRHNCRHFQHSSWSFLGGRCHQRCNPHYYSRRRGRCHVGWGWGWGRPRQWYDEDVHQRRYFHHHGPWWG